MPLLLLLPLKEEGLWNEEAVAQLRGAGRRQHKKSVGVRHVERPFLSAGIYLELYKSCCY